jgi:LysM repeat protein
MTKNIGTASNQMRRCPNCGSRVAQEADTCYFCGFNLSGTARRRRRVTWVDLGLVVALLLLVAFWWQMGSSSDGSNAQAEAVISTPTPGDPLQPQVPQVAIIATTTPVSASEPTPGPLVVVHTVQSGETLSSIAIQYSVTVEEIQQTNGLTGALIRAGDELVIPIPQVVSENSNQVGVPGIFRYTVQPGDTIVSIAVRFGATVEGILGANGISTSDFIRPEQVLRIPLDVPASAIASSEAARGDVLPVGYAAPRLLEPQEGAALPRSEEVIFRWISVDLLAPNEWYVLRIWPVEGAVGLLPAVWTKVTSYRLRPDTVPITSATMTYGWQVTVVRILPDQGQGRGIEAASVPSEVRNFTWR